MNRRLFDIRRELTTEETGRHSHRWGIFAENAHEFLLNTLTKAVDDNDFPSFGISNRHNLEQLISQGEPAGFGLLHTGLPTDESRNGLMMVFERGKNEVDGELSNILRSAFPLFGDGNEVVATVSRLFLFPNRLEARLELCLADGGMIEPFDPLFWLHRGMYREGEIYRFSVAAMAYGMGAPPEVEHVIDDEDSIRRFHARQAWMEQHGTWSREDEEASLAVWQPQSPEDLEPIRISVGEAAMLVGANSGAADNAMYQGEAVRVIPRALRMMGVDFWRVDAVVIRAREDFVLPIYVAEHLFEGDWRPEVGQYVFGKLWLQAYAKDIVQRS